MSTLVHGRDIAPPRFPPDSSPFVTVRLFLAIARFAETHAWIAFATVSLAFGWQHCQILLSRNLDHDELFTFYIAQAPTFSRMLQLTHAVDLHPPLSYALVRICFNLLGVSTWSCRFPFIVAFVAGSAVIFWFMQRLVAPIYGLIAVAIWWSVPFTAQATQARPYALIVCFTSLMIATWYEAITRPDGAARRWILIIFAISGLGLLLSHVLGSLPYAVFGVAELLRWWKRRHPDWWMWTALAAPLPSVLSYLPLIQNQSTILFAREYQLTGLRMFSFYWESIRRVATPFAVIAILVLLWPAMRWRFPKEESLPKSLLTEQILIVLGLLSLVPLAIGLVFARTGTAFFDRYGIVWLIPLTLAPPLILGYRTDRNRLAGSIVFVALAIVFFFNTTGKAWLISQVANIASPHTAAKLLYPVELFGIYPPPNNPPVPPYLSNELSTAKMVSGLDSFRVDLPLVAHTGLTFLELDHLASTQLTDRLYFLTDERAAANIAHDTVFAHYERLKDLFPIRGKVEAYCSFISEHSNFMVVGTYNNPQGWLLRKLDQDGAQLRVVGNCPPNTEECHIYEVQMHNIRCQPEGD